MEILHSELQKWHYGAVRESAEYRLEGLVDIYLEEIAMNMPRFLEQKEVKPQQGLSMMHYHVYVPKASKGKGISIEPTKLLR